MSQLFDNRPLDAPVAYAKVALEQGIDLSPDGLTYGVPAALSDLIIGERVSVPLGRGNKAVSGYVMAISDTCDLPKEKHHLIKAIVARDDSGITLTPDLVELAKWMAGYYCCPLGMVFATMLPAAVKHGTGRVKREMVGIEKSFEFKVQGSELKDTEMDTAIATPPSNNSELRTLNSELPPAPKLTKLQKSIIEAAIKQRDAGHDFTEIRELADIAGAKTISPIRQLIAKGVFITQTQSAVRAAESLPMDDKDGRNSGAAGLALTADQAAAVTAISSRLNQGFSVTLLHGVTGSGKTEVYLSAIERMQVSSKFKVQGSKLGNTNASQPESSASATLNFEPGTLNSSSPAALILVPEIALTPQTVSRFQRRFGQVAVLHSGLTAAQRHEQWRRIRSGDVRIVVGARSAIFAPLAGIGLIVVDEEHEASYKQDQLPRYHARDVAIKRGQLLSIPVLLGSATPSLESYYNAGGDRISSEFKVQSSRSKGTDDGQHTVPLPSNLELRTLNSELPASRPRFHLLRLPTRVPGLALPKVEIVDLSEERKKRYEYTGKAGIHLVSIRLEAAIKRTMDAKQQTLLLLNRRGYANYIACPDHKCGWLLKCDYCDVTMVFHKDGKLPAGGYVHCHHCTAKQMLPSTCPLCNKKVTVFGLGTQRVEEELLRKFPSIRMIRMDSDSMQTGKDYAESLDQFRAGLVDVLVGTQMIAKGLDFPNVQLVGVISADTSLHMPDFRAAERTFQLIAQVAGRAGRGSDPGTVIVQTFNPLDPAITLASHHDFDTFAHDELKLRSAMGLPPVSRMARIVVRDKDHLDCVEYAKQLANHLNETNEQMKLGVRIRGPAACPISRIAEFYRLQIELIGKDAATLQKLMTALRNARLLKSDNHVAIDVDPVSLM